MTESQAEQLKKHKLKLQLAKKDSRMRSIRQTQGGDGVKMKVSLARMSWDNEKDKS